MLLIWEVVRVEDIKNLSPEEWQEWLESQGTREFFRYLDKFKQSLLEALPENLADREISFEIRGKIQMIDEMKKELEDKSIGG